MNQKIRPAVLADTAALANMCRMDPDPWSQAQFEEELLRAHATTYVLECTQPPAQQPDAAIVVLCVADVWEILNLLVCPAQRRRGLAQKLLQYVFELAQKASVQAMLLEVRASNIAALALYEKLGFIQVGTRRGYYQQSGEDAYVMRCALRAIG